MSETYDKYLNEHLENVFKARKWLTEDGKNLKRVIKILPNLMLFNSHDYSKTMKSEYEAYDNYFNGPHGIKDVVDGPSEEVQTAFDHAWLHHIHHNPHHWQYWVLIEDDPTEVDGEAFGIAPFNAVSLKPLDIPDMYLFEMICDWWSFSLRGSDPYAIFNWWNDHSDYIVLSSKTREKVVAMLELIREMLGERGEELFEKKEEDDGREK